MCLKIRRLLALAIDYLISFYISYYLARILVLLSDTQIVTFIAVVTAFIVLYSLFTRKDTFFGYESIGKKLTRLKIYQNGERVKDKKILKDRIKASVPTFPLYMFMILINNKSVGDKEYNTEVK